MKRKETFLIVAVVFTVMTSVLLFFFDFYNYHFEFKRDSRENTYVVLKNGRYFEFLCANDVIDNGVDFTLKPFNEFSVENTGNMFKNTLFCKEDDSSIEKKVVFERSARRIRVKQNIVNNFDSVGEGSFYYTHIEYPLVFEVQESPEYLKLYDLNCTTTIFKKKGYEYKIVDNFVRIGVEYENEVDVIFEMEVECL